MPEGKTLSQWEVDALLSAFSGEAAAPDPQSQPARARTSRPVKNYDFRRPDKFSKEQLRSLHLLHENFTRLLGTSLTSYLRGAVSLHLTSVEQITYAEYSEQLPKPTVLYITSLDPLPGRAVLEINVPVAFAIIDRLLGGPGEVAPLPVSRQGGELSEIEVALLRSLADNLTAALHDAWSDIFTVTPTINDIAFSSELVQAALPNEICVLVIMEMRVLNSAGTISLCMPYTLLEPIIGSLSAQALVAGSFKTARKEDPLAQQRTLRQLERVTLPASVRLGGATVTVRDLLTLEAGDIICLDTAASGTLDLLIDGRPRHRVRPGMAGARLAVRIEQVVPPDPADPEEPSWPRPELLSGVGEGTDKIDEQRIAV